MSRFETYTNYGSRPWMMLVEQYGMPEEEAKRLVLNSQHAMVRWVLAKAEELGYKKVSQ